MTLGALPARDQVKHVHTLVTLALRFTPLTTQLNTPRRKERTIGARVNHLDQARVEIDLTCQSRNCHKTCSSDAEDGCYGF